MVNSHIKRLVAAFMLLFILAACSSDKPSFDQSGVSLKVNSKFVFSQTAVINVSDIYQVSTINFIVHTKPDNKS
jgi:hypothetical protein